MTEKIVVYTQKINKMLEQSLSNGQEHPGSQTIYESMRYSVLGKGKRIRPIMTLAFCALCGEQESMALPFACAIEMVHAYSLIHDDLPCMDNDTLRRGKPTNHIVYGEAVALLAGDALLTKAFEVAAGAVNVTPQSIVSAVKLLARLAGADSMVGGQCLDLTLDQDNTSIELLKLMDTGKTVGLISAACQMGCIAASAEEPLQMAADLYAQSMGMAFQIRDDILGAVGKTAELGKTVGLDADNGKQNYVSLLGIEKAQELVAEYTKQAISALYQFPGNTDFLKELTISLVERTI